MTLVLLIGGARSGKSTRAVRLATATGAPVVFVATGEAGDEEMAARIERHRSERPDGWQTVEEPLHLLGTLESVAADACVVVDCLSFWVANALGRGADVEDVEAEATAAARIAAKRRATTIAVTNEVGLGIVPVTLLGRTYRDVLGRVNAIWAEAADESWLLVAGKTLRLGDD
jgi:adenosyl cobinamide kinase/adenosyl cobinamide phosphate guanylyltransferase